MPTTRTRVFFTPSTAALDALATVSASSGVPISALVAELIGFCEPRLLDMAALLTQLDAIKSDLVADLADFPGEVLLSDLAMTKVQQLHKAIAAASSRLESVKASAGIGYPLVADLQPLGHS